MKRMAAVAVGAFALVAVEAGPARSADFTGVWRTQSGDADVKIAKCGSSYCGTIVRSKTGGTDVKNPDPARRGQKIVGLRMMYDLQPQGTGFKGKLYDFTSGKTYSGKASLSGPNSLKLSGCVAAIFCRSQIWTRLK